MGHGRHSRTSSDEKAAHISDIRDLAKYIASEQCSKIVLMLGAGISTSAGIPDFRTPGTGLYSNLERLKLPYPEAVFEINYFRRNPIPFYTLASELYPGSFRPTLTHSFVKLLSDRGLLYMCFTQNIDTLERRAGVPPEKIVEAHGSFATQRCIDCKHPFPDDTMLECVVGRSGDKVRIPHCQRDECDGLVKPDIVFFGEGLPAQFFQKYNEVSEADLLIIIGTSLTVHPFASLAHLADRETCRRVLINLQRVGDLGHRPSDIVLLGECDAVVKELCAELGWTEDLDNAWAKTQGTVRSAVVMQKANTEKPKEETKVKSRVPNENLEKVIKDIQKLSFRDAESEITDEVQTPSSNVLVDTDKANKH